MVSREAVRRDAMSLSDDDRLMLGIELLQSAMDTDEDDELPLAEFRDEWRREIKRRLDALDNGAPTLDWDEAMERLFGSPPR